MDRFETTVKISASQDIFYWSQTARGQILKCNKMTSLNGRKRPSAVPLESLAAEFKSAKDVPKVKKDKKEKKDLPQSKFGGMTEEEVCKLVLPDHMKAGLDIIFVSANKTMHIRIITCESKIISHIKKTILKQQNPIVAFFSGVFCINW